MEQHEQVDDIAQPAKILHDLNQPLSAIHSYALAGTHLVENNPADAARIKELFKKISQQCTRATVLSHQLGKAVAALPPAKDPA